MREFKIFLVLVIFTGIVYWGVEPYAHSQMNEHTSAVNFDFKAEDINQAKVELEKAMNSDKTGAEKEKDIEFAKMQLKDYEQLWANVDKIASLKADVSNGKEAFELNCASCHRASFDGFNDADDSISAYGIIYPDLSTAGAIYDDKFLMAISLNPALAMKNHKKYNEQNPHPMLTAFLEEDGSISEENAQSVADIVAYLKSIGNKALLSEQEKLAKEINASKMSDEDKQKAIDFSKKKLVFEHACARCHDVKYDKLFAKINANDLAAYMGSIPPDLSMVIRAKGEEYLNKFLNDTQKQLAGTAMPRVGLNAHSQEEVISYLSAVGDSKKAERESLGIKIMIYFAVMAVLAFLWKKAIWKDLH